MYTYIITINVNKLNLPVKTPWLSKCNFKNPAYIASKRQT